MKNVLSLFNGISGCHLALDRTGIEYDTVYYSEIDKFANQVTEHHYPQDVALGDVTKWQEWDMDWSSIDLVTAGFPCQAWSVAGQQQGDKDPRGALFWTTLDIIKKVLTANPSAKFMMENVKMKKDFEEYITHHTTEALGYVEKTLINSALVSAQNRNRYYWTNFKVEQPEDKGILLKDVLEDGLDAKGGAIRGRYNKDGTISQRLELNGTEKTNTLTTVQKDNVVVLKNESATKDNKSYSLTASYGGAVAWNSCERKQRTMVPVGQSEEDNPNVYNGIFYRKLTPIECERLQTVPDNFTSILSNTQRYKSLGNGWTIDVIAHIFSFIK